MYAIHDVEAVQKAFDNAQVSRSWKDIVDKIYPGAHYTSNGRVLSPYTGYTCNITGRQYGAYEPLPVSSCSSVDDIDDKLLSGDVIALDETGTRHIWTGGSEEQRAASALEALYQSCEVASNKSSHIGNIGERVYVTGTIFMKKKWRTFRGKQYWYYNIHSDVGDVVQYFGSGNFGEIEDHVSITVRVRHHDVMDGIRSTIVDFVKQVNKR